MPIYEYQCKDCNSRFDLLRPMRASDEDVKCKDCGGSNVTKLLSMFASSGGSSYGGGYTGGGGCSPSGGFS
ncbi:zinc ribbon domain-containing protein [candidate division KSB1 bacterium]|nr:zinc ribbon domain-containing protein [candidate division KSB1 bacterium]